MSVVVRGGVERLARAFERAKAERRLALAVYLTVGFPDLASTPALLRAALDAGADVIELGVPFSDPLADGATVQRASEIALREGVGLGDCLRVAGDLVAERDAAVVLMGYTNPFVRYGTMRLATRMRELGVAGLIVPDLPMEEAGLLDRDLAAADLARIEMLAPTTPDERIAKLLASARGFAYCVSLTGVTGARHALGQDVGAFVARTRRHAPAGLPIVVGFGISGPEHVRALRGTSDGVAVGSAVIDAVTRGGERALRDFVASLAVAARS